MESLETGIALRIFEPGFEYNWFKTNDRSEHSL